MRQAVLIALGDELLSGVRREGNCSILANRLTQAGWKILRIEILPDGPDVLEDVLPPYYGEVDLVVISGGLGPTHDDCTRFAIARLLNVPLRVDRPAYERILDRYPPDMRANLERCAESQGSIPVGAKAVHNPVGSALGISFVKEGTRVYAFPGVPAEFAAMVEQELASDLARSERGVRSVVVAGWAESLLKDRVAELTGDESLQVSILPSAGTVEIVVKGELDRVDRAVGQIRSTFSDDCLTEGRNSVAEDLLLIAREKGLTISCAESCTGGLVSAAMTDVPGSSASFLGGAVCYSNQSKMDILSVPEETLRDHGAVSEECALFMARGAIARFRSSVAVATTGIAGPDGGSDDKPVGTVCFSISGVCGEESFTQRFPGGRYRVRIWARNRALNILRKALLRVNNDD